ncbi:MAG: hypothetical protein SV253_07905 [Halobacteria archaeon]|nr:hypothetical protein [Halobacteria archaeon]
MPEPEFRRDSPLKLRLAEEIDIDRVIDLFDSARYKIRHLERKRWNVSDDREMSLFEIKISEDKRSVTVVPKESTTPGSIRDCYGLLDEEIGVEEAESLEDGYVDEEDG